MYTFQIPAMSCSHCVHAITEAVQQADPAAQVQADLAGHRVEVRTQAPREAVVAQLVDAGYPPE